MGYFEIVGKDLLDDDIEIAVTEEGIQALLPELSADILESLLEAKQITVPHRDPAKIAPIKLLFDQPTQLQLKPIQRMLQPQIRAKINQTFQTQNKGISILLYGYPGTGKTEFCLQLAKDHNLPIMEVNVAQIQNKWVGESEKNARNVFKQYRKLRKQSQRECILLFNEADALFSKRVDVNSSVDSMNNALKNIFWKKWKIWKGSFWPQPTSPATSMPPSNVASSIKWALQNPTPKLAPSSGRIISTASPWNKLRNWPNDLIFHPGKFVM